MLLLWGWFIYNALSLRLPPQFSESLWSQPGLPGNVLLSLPEWSLSGGHRPDLSRSAGAQSVLLWPPPPTGLHTHLQAHTPPQAGALSNQNWGRCAQLSKQSPIDLNLCHLYVQQARLGENPLTFQNFLFVFSWNITLILIQLQGEQYNLQSWGILCPLGWKCRVPTLMIPLISKTVLYVFPKHVHMLRTSLCTQSATRLFHLQ